MGLTSLPCYCATIRQAARAVTLLYEAALADCGLHATQLTALQVIEAIPDVSTTELADAIGIDQTTATRNLALVRKAGLAIDRSGNDRRERRWRLTAEGEVMLRRLKPKWDAAQAAFEKRVGRAEARQLKRASYQAANRLSAA
jgi:DNA-binding MarR family transcriptional regulator